MLVTNDDGASSGGLLALSRAFARWADVVVVAPLDQESRASRATPAGRSGRILKLEVALDNSTTCVYAVDGTPAQAVQYALVEVLSTRPSLVVSGINYGENVGITSTVSGTVGAILEAASWGIPCVAFSQEMPGGDTLANPSYDFSVAAELSSTFGLTLLGQPTSEVPSYKVDFPVLLSRVTPWRTTFVSRIRKYDVRPPVRRALWERGPLDLDHDAWRSKVENFEIGSDAYVLFVERGVSVTPITPDPTCHAALAKTRSLLEAFSGRR